MKDLVARWLHSSTIMYALQRLVCEILAHVPLSDQ
jgi:hypothetical protein